MVDLSIVFCMFTRGYLHKSDPGDLPWTVGGCSCETMTLDPNSISQLNCEDWEVYNSPKLGWIAPGKRVHNELENHHVIAG